MQDITVKIGAVGEPPLFQELKPDSEGIITHVGVLEKGMASGATSLSFYVRTPDGRLTWVQMSAGMLQTIAAAVSGADERFKGKEK